MLAGESMSHAPGTRIGPYEIIASIGAGGMGEVYKARDERLDRSVAIKILPAELAQNEQFKRRFEREAKTISQLSHPHICTVFDVGDDYIVMELLEGESLADRVERGPLSLTDVLKYGAQIADALHRAHRAQIVHRDLKPANVMITKSGAKLLDFGLAKSGPAVVDAGGATQQKPLTEEGTILGTFQYMSPEQLEAGDTDARSDVWGLGCVLYEMATGRAPFAAGNRASLISAILRDQPPPLSRTMPLLPRALDRLVRGCLAKDPDARWQSAHDVAAELRSIEEEQASLDREGPGGQPAAAPTRGRWLRLGAAIAFIAAIAFAAGMWKSSRPDSAPANPVPVVVLLDSTHPLRVYDPETRAHGGTNADDLTDLLHDLPVVILKENTTWTWHREDEVLRQHPDLIVAHRSCFYVPSGLADDAFERDFYARAADKFETFMAYVALGNPRTKFLVYSRRSWANAQERAAWVQAVENRYPHLRGRVTVYSVPLDRATFRNPHTGAEIRAMAIRILALKSK